MMKLIPTSTRGKVRAATFLTAGVVVLGGFAIQGQVRAAQYQHLLNKTYEYAFAELSTSVSQLDTALQKGIYATSPQLFSSLCTEAFRSALAAQTALGSLPYGNVELEGTATFLAKTGDYTMSLSRASAQGLSEEQRATLAALSQRASALCQTLQSLESDLYSGTLRLGDLAQVQERLSQATETGGQTTAGSSFQEIEQECSELPTLIYDGPFSDHLADRTPRMLEGQPQVSREDARSAAAGWLGQEPQLFTPVSDGAGVLPSWGFSAQVDGGELYVEVTKQGGQLLEILHSRPVGPAQFSREQAAARAKAFLKQLGYPDMAETYFIDQGNILTINFAGKEGDVLCYPDLVKVSVALDNGGIVGLESRNYLMNHQSRSFSPPAVSAEEARAQVTRGLEVLSQQLTLIPTEGEHEILCHEFKCRNEKGQHYILYVNAETGAQERILLLLEDENGTLVL